jgi:ATP-dependent DNA helicase PIF1
MLHRIERKLGGLIFLDTPDGTEKAFVINLLLAKIHQQSEIAIAVATSGIAATLFHGGRTAHSTLKPPLNLTYWDAPLCIINKRTGDAKLLQECALIVWDKCTMVHRQALQALERTLQDLNGNAHRMVGVLALLAGDVRQTLPIISRGTVVDELEARLKSSALWKHVYKLRAQNERICEFICKAM